jgi:hypothetical protein
MLTARQFILLGMLASVACLGYFWMLDRILFSSAFFAPIFRFLLIGYDAQTAWLSVAVCFLAVAWKGTASILYLIDWTARKPVWIAAASTVAIALASTFVYHDYPFSMDEYAAFFQAKIFAAGQLTARLPASVVDWLVWPHFNGMFLVASRTTGQAVESYWPGFALLLAPFEFLGAPWLCNPLLAGMAVYLVYRITLDITGDKRAAGWAMLFTLASSTFLANAISYYSMQAHLTANLLFAWLLLTPTSKRALAAGLVGSLALLLNNPFPHTLFALPWLAAMAAEKTQRRYLPAVMLGYLPGISLGFAWLWLRMNIVATDHGLLARSSGWFTAFTLPGPVLLDMRAASVAKMWIWAIPCLFLLALLGYTRYRAHRAVRLLGQSAALTFIGYLFVGFDQGHGWGYRYFHSAWGTIPALAACAMAGASAPQPRLISFVGAASVLSLVVLVPFQMNQIDRIISQHLAQIPRPQGPGNTVYFLRPYGGFYLGDMIQIDPLLRDRNLLLASRGPDLDAALIRENWPDAIMKGHGRWGQEWYLGDSDQRRSTNGPDGGKHFLLGFEPIR